jgi:hypothetical protein
MKAAGRRTSRLGLHGFVLLLFDGKRRTAEYLEIGPGIEPVGELNTVDLAVQPVDLRLASPKIEVFFPGAPWT